MIPLGIEATDAVLAWGDGRHRAVALRHAAIHGRPGLWGDDPVRPSSLVWLRDGGDQWEVFAAGRAEPALDWLASTALGRPIVLAAPPAWEPVVRSRVGPQTLVERTPVQTWVRPEPLPLPARSVAVRPLAVEDAGAFEAVAPSWSLRSWGDFASLIERGAAFGVPDGPRLAALAWVVESDLEFDKVGVATDPRFARLGLGRAVASALIGQIEGERARRPLWVVHPGNLGSIALAQSLGFAHRITENLLRWEVR